MIKRYYVVTKNNSNLRVFYASSSKKVINAAQYTYGDDLLEVFFENDKGQRKVCWPKPTK
jgi:hypothetical protein